MIISIINLSALQERRIDPDYYDHTVWSRLKAIFGHTVTLGAMIEKPCRNPMCYGFNYSQTREIPFIRIDDLQSPHIDYESAAYITPEINDRYSSTKLNRYDLILGVRGNTIGRLGVFMGADGMANMSPNVIRLRARDREDVPFMAFFLVSDFGQKLIKRETSGTGQPTITADLIEKIRIIRVSEEEKRNFVIHFHDYCRLIDETSFLVHKAQQLLESELGLDNLKFKKPVGYTARFSELENSRRFDPEYYYPEFDAFANSLPPGISLSPLNRYLTFCQRGKQPIYSAAGLRVINSKHVQPNRVLFDGNRFAAANPNGNLQIRHGDTLLNGTGRGTLGRTAPYLIDEPAVPDNHVTILRSDDLDPVYLSLYLNSAAGQMQVEMHQRGTSGQLELYPFDVRKLLIWPAPESFQQELRRLHDKAAAAERESKQLLEQAKSRVEQLIEEAARG